MFVDLGHFSKHLPKRNIAIIATILLILLGLPLLVKAKKKKHPDCSTCKDIVKDFEEGLKKTSKSGYGGGNTNWEEKSLGSFAKSETRFVEITEDHMCKDGSKECHLMKEKYEDHLEAFWFNEFGKKGNTDFHQWFCIDAIEACCKENTYGPECKPCLGDPKRPCTGNGNCDGEGTRGGTGECKCHSGYSGEKCDECMDGYFEDHKNDSYVTCRACHISCKNLCSEDGPKGCDECKDGWTQTEEEGCKDIDECSAGTSNCNENQYCLNTEGSFACMSCDKSCKGCTGSGNGKCKECNTGFVPEGDKCTDIDECTADSSLCSAEKEKCVNEPGTYSCQCEEGYQRNYEEKCVKKPKEGDDEEDDEKEEEEEVEEEDTEAQDKPAADSAQAKEEL